MPRTPASPNAPTSVLSTRFAAIFASAFSGDLAAALTTVTIPLLIVGPLRADDGVVGIAVAADDVGWLIAGPLAGVLIDRFGFTRLMLGSELLRFLTSAAIVLLALTEVLHPAVLIALLLLKSVAGVVFVIGSPSLLAAGIAPDDLVRANSALTWSQSVALIAGPPLAGALIGLTDPSAALSVTAVGYLISFVLLALILRRGGWPSQHHPTSDNGETEPAEHRSSRLADLATDFATGWRYLTSRTDVLRMVACGAQFNLALSMQQAVLVIYLLTLPGFTPSTIGLALGAAGFGGVCAALFADTLARRIGDRHLVFWSMLLGTGLGLLIPLTTSATGIAFLIIGYVGLSIATVVFSAITGSYRQRTIPLHLLGRVTAASRLISWGIAPLGALSGAAIASAHGPWWGLTTSAIIFLGSAFWLTRIRWQTTSADAYP